MTRAEIEFQRIVQLVEDQAKNYKELTQTEGLTFIANNLNKIVDRVRMGEHFKLEDLPYFLSLIEDDPSFQQPALSKLDPLRCWKAIEPIVETMTDQVNWRKPYHKSLGSIIKGQSWNSNMRNPLPELSIAYFNNLAHQYPIPLFIFKDKGKKIYPEHTPTEGMQLALWYLWRFFFHDRGWERLKRCPKCLRWFVDDTRNKQKLRCSPHCTWQWWSRDKRKKARHKPPKYKERRKEG